MGNKNSFRFAYGLSQTAENNEAEILIYSEIVPWKWGKDDPEITAADFDKLLKEAKNSGAEKLRLRINSPGGNVWQAVAMKTMVENGGFEEVYVDIEGLCASAATFFTCIPGAKVRIAEGSDFMIHNPMSGARGTAKDLLRIAQMLQKTEEEQHAMYANRTGQSEEKIKEWMDAETWFTAKETVESGFADEILRGVSSPAACVSEESLGVMREMYAHIPEDVAVGKTKEAVRNEGPQVAGGSASEHTESKKEETKTMEIKDITAEQLREGNPELYMSLVSQGTLAERQRMQEIDELTDKGFEELAQKAKNEGTSAADFLKQVVTQRKNRREGFAGTRKQELSGAGSVTGGASGDNDGITEDDEIRKNAKEMAEFAKGLYGASGGSMF